MTHLSFEEFNFEVINVENPKNNVLTINKGAISFDRSIAECLRFPSHIRPLIDKENKIFAIQSCRSLASKAVPFSKTESKQKGSVKIQSIVIRNAIKMLMTEKWSEDKRYQIEGRYIEEHKAFIFDLNDYKELPLFKIERKIKTEVI